MIYPRFFLAIFLLLALNACSKNSGLDPCLPFDGLQPVCGFQMPEDLAVLPDGSGLLVSEFGAQGEQQGRISVMDLATRSHRTLYSTDSSNDMRLRNPIWGDPACTEPEAFSPHGIDLNQRGVRWQLLVVNHGGRESVEFFELLQRDGEWQLDWQGCVEAVDDSAFNDVTAFTGGFYVTRMMSRETGIGALLDYFLGRPTGHLWQWTLQDGLTVVEGTTGAMPNGVLVSPDNRTIYLNLYGEKKIRILDRRTGDIIREVPVESADNSIWDPADTGKLLVASHEMSLLSMLSCMSSVGDNCAIDFSIFELDTQTFELRPVFASNGEFFGAGTAAVRIDSKLYIGSFAGDRILIAPEGYGLQ